MEKNTNRKGCAPTGRFTVKPLGKKKADKFGRVEKGVFKKTIISGSVLKFPWA